MTQSQLIDSLVARLARDHGKSKTYWRRLLGPVQFYSIETHAHCNWAIHATGTHPEIKQIERLLDDVRLSHPIVRADC